MLNHPHPQLRALTLRLLGRIKAQETAFQIMALYTDESPVTFLDQGKAVTTTVAALAREATAAIHEDKTNGQ